MKYHLWKEKSWKKAWVQNVLFLSFNCFSSMGLFSNGGSIRKSNWKRTIELLTTIHNMSAFLTKENLFNWVYITYPSPAISTRGWFHQHFMISFCNCRSQKHKKTLVTWLSFTLLGSASVKTARKHVG